MERKTHAPIVLWGDTESPLVIGWQDKFGTPGLDVRHYWCPPDADGIAPTKKGVRVADRDVPEFIRALMNLISGWSPEEFSCIGDALQMNGWDAMADTWRELFLTDGNR